MKQWLKNNWLKIGLSLILVIGFATGLFIYNQQQHSKMISDKIDTIAQPQIQLNQIKITNLALNNECSAQFAAICSGNYKLTGEITNNSTNIFNSLVGTIQVYDCPEKTITSTCSKITEGTAQLYVAGDVEHSQIQPNQVRTVSEPFAWSIEGMPPIKGNFLWSFTPITIKCCKLDEDIVSIIANNPDYAGSSTTDISNNQPSTPWSDIFLQLFIVVVVILAGLAIYLLLRKLMKNTFMKQWLNSNWFKIAILIILLCFVIAFVVFVIQFHPPGR